MVILFSAIGYFLGNIIIGGLLFVMFGNGDSPTKSEEQTYSFFGKIIGAVIGGIIGGSM